jgi:DNA modification methylase
LIRFITGDSTKLLAKFRDNSVDFVFFDPPYNVNKDYGTYKDNQTEPNYEIWMRYIIRQCQRISRKGIAVYVGSKRTLLFWSLIPDARCIIVRKGAISFPEPNQYFRQWCSLLVTRTPLKKCYDIWDGIRLPGEGYFFREQRFKHPGFTPEKLVYTVLHTFTRQGETILDPFSGTGTTGIVAKKMKRNAILIELNPAYTRMARQRLKGANTNG